MRVVIPTHGRPTLLGRTLRSVAACDRPDSLAEVVVVENGSRDGAEAVVAEVAAGTADGPGGPLPCRYAHRARANKSDALNAVARDLADRGRGRDLLVFLDDDVRLAPATLTAYAAAHAAAEAGEDANGGGAFFCGPMGVDYEIGGDPPAAAVPLLPPSAVGWAWEGGPVVDEPVAMGCNWAAPAETLLACGGFDERFGPGGTSGGRGQETDMQARLLAAGVTGRYVPDAKVWHHVPADRCDVAWLLDRAYAMGLSDGSRGFPDEAARGTARATAGFFKEQLKQAARELRAPGWSPLALRVRWRRVRGTFAGRRARPAANPTKNAAADPPGAAARAGGGAAS